MQQYWYILNSWRYMAVILKVQMAEVQIMDRE